jgi:hypothetical protein
VRSYYYQLIPKRSGTLIVPELELEYSDAYGTDTLAAEPLKVRIAEPRPRDAAGSSYWLIVVVVVLTIGAATIVWWRRRATRSELERAPDLEARYRSALQELLRQLSRQDYRGFSDGAMKLIVQLLESIEDTRLSGHTALDLISHVKSQDYEDELVERLRRLFDFCDNVKYASGSVDADAAAQVEKDLEKTVELLVTESVQTIKDRSNRE